MVKKEVVSVTNTGICRIIRDPIISKNHIYEGQINDKLERHGFGRQILANGDYFIGGWRNDVQDGPGRYQ